MLCKLSGYVSYQGAGFVFLEVGGVGYQIFIPKSLCRELTGECSLYIYEVIRDSGRELFGFTELKGWELAKKLVSVPGVGPKLAQKIVYGAPLVGGVVEKIEAGDVTFLSSISGVGKKTAQKIVLELKGKLVQEESVFVNEDACLALVGLGYGRREVELVLSELCVNEKNTDELIREALRLLGK